MSEPEYTAQHILNIEASGIPMPGRRVCVSGGRTFMDQAFVWDHLDMIHRSPEGRIEHIGFGCATGVDELALGWALSNNIPWVRYEADWDRWGSAGGSIRNIVMLEHFAPDVLLVFPGGTGTTHCTRSARKRGIDRIFFNQDEDPFIDAAKWG